MVKLASRYAAWLLTLSIPVGFSGRLAASGQESAREGSPTNLKGGVFQTVVDRMWRQSPTFRRQCGRVAASPELTVFIRLDSPHTPSSVRAFTTFSRKNGSIVKAEIVLLSASQTIELIAHELEHVIEQLDGVDLTGHHAAGAAHAGANTFESERAIEAGRRVAREVESGHALMNFRQRDAWSSPLDPASSSVSADGRLVAFTSSARLTADDQNDLIDLYVLDLKTQRLTLESGQLGTVSRYSRVLYPRISGDGHLVVFQATADDDVRSEVVVLDRLARVAHVVGTDPSSQAGGNSSPAISADGSTVVFESTSTKLVGHRDSHRSRVTVYLVRLGTGRVTPVSVARNGELPDAGDSVTPAVSADGRYVAFTSTADLICTNASCSRTSRAPKRVADIYVRDTIANTTSCVSRSVTGADANGPSSWPAMSGDGRYIVFTSEASNLVRGDRNGQADIFLHDTQSDTTVLISRRPDGRSAGGASRNPAISDDGTTVAFQSLASDLICVKQCHGSDRDINLVWDVFVFDRRSSAMQRASADDSEEWMEPSRRPSLSSDGRVVIFSSQHPIRGDDAFNDDDLYVWIRLGG